MDRLTEMEAFATVVDQGGFTDAARKLGMSKSAVSKHVSSLEARLGTRLLNRTTRRVSPTDIGLAYYDRARRLLNDAGEADAIVSCMHSAPSGLLRFAVPADLAVNHVSPVLGRFLTDYPEITVNMVLSTGRLDLSDADFDVAIRVGEADDGRLVSRRLARSTTRLVASPAYFARHGRPRRIDDLNAHRLLHNSAQAEGCVWQLRAPSGELRQVRTPGWLTVNDGQSLLAAAVAGLGIAYLPNYLFAGALRAGDVEEAIPDLPVEVQDVRTVYAPGRFTQPKVRALLDFLSVTFADRDIDDW